jgi:hypothetical protein
MKKIQALSLWYDGAFKDATLFAVSVNNIVLGTSASISFALYSSFENEADYPDRLLNSGVLSLEGQEYLDWGTDDNYVWEWAANKLNLTII